MANTLLTPDMILREALRILHQKLNFVGSIYRQYDDQFAKEGGKIGASLRIRLPNEYTVRTGATLSVQDTVESSTTLTVATQKGVDTNFTSQELTLSLDDFSRRVLNPAMARLAAAIEADALSMHKDVYNLVDGDAAVIAFDHIMSGRQVLNDNLAPLDDQRTCLLSTKHNSKLVSALKGLFQDSGAIKEQYREGMMGRTGGFDFYESTHLTDDTTGTAIKATGYLSNGVVAQTGATIAIDTGTTTFKKGDVITFATVTRVHPETKVDTGVLQQFALTADYAGGAGNISITPSVVATGGSQNVNAGIPDNVAITKVGAAASELLNSSMVYHKEAFAIAFADLIDVSQFGAWGARKVQDGISMRIARQYDITNDKFPTRIDVLYGFKTIRPQLACRIHADG